MTGPTIVAGQGYSLALRADGRVLTWGDGMTGATARTGIAGTALSVLSNLSNVAGLAISRGNSGHVALAADGSARAWGYDFNGSFGDWWRDTIDVPIAVPQFGNAAQAGVADCATQHRVWLSLHGDGTVWTTPGIAEPGSGPQPSVITPSQVPGLPAIRALGHGPCATAIATDGRLFSLSSSMVSRNTPTFAYVYSVVANEVVGIPLVADASCDISRCFVAGQDGSVWAWGENANGEFGDGTFTSRTIPIQVPGLSQITKVVTSQSGVTFAIDTAGQVYSWAGVAASDDLLGRGRDPNDPTFKQLPRRITSLTLPVRELDARQHAIVRLSDGSVWAWGYAGSGGLGDGTTNSSDVPIRVLGL